MPGWTFEHYTGDASSASQLLPSTSSFLSYFFFFCSFFHSYFSCFTSVTPPPFISSSTHIFLLLNLFILILVPSAPQLFSSSFLLFRGRPKPPSHHSALQRQIHPDNTQAVIVIILIIMITPSPSSPSLTLHSPATETSCHRSCCHRHHDFESSLSSSSSILVRWHIPKIPTEVLPIGKNSVGISSGFLSSSSSCRGCWFYRLWDTLWWQCWWWWWS